MSNEEQEISLHEIVDVVKRRWRLIILPAAITSLIAGGISKALPKKYESYSLLRVGYAGTQPFDSVASVKLIMNSLPVVEQIKEKSGLSNTETLKYEEMDSLLKISAKASNPNDAQSLVRSATEILLERHQKINDYSQQRLGRMVTYVKEILRPVPLSSGINDFMIEQTRIEVPPLLTQKPIKVKVSLTMLLTFIGTFFVDMLIAFYREGETK